jgi:hypothetical protein
VRQGARVGGFAAARRTQQQIEHATCRRLGHSKKSRAARESPDFRGTWHVDLKGFYWKYQHL